MFSVNLAHSLPEDKTGRITFSSDNNVGDLLNYLTDSVEQDLRCSIGLHEYEKEVDLDTDNYVVGVSCRNCGVKLF